jgi:phosphatidylinositol-3-phosphatase
MPRTKQLVLFLILTLTAASPLVQVPAKATTSSSAYFDYVVVILLENRGINQTYGSSCPGDCSYITQLADTYGLARGYSAVIHHSLPDYLALTSGWSQSLQGTNGDCSPLPTSVQYCPNINPQLNGQFPFQATNIVDRLEAAGLTWKAYIENFPSACNYLSQKECSPGNCYVGYGGVTGNYDSQHDPFVYYNDITTSMSRCGRIIQANSTLTNPDDRLISDLSSTNSASNFMWVTPNVCNQGHDLCAPLSNEVAQQNHYLSQVVPQILSSNVFTTQRAALFITYDEGTGTYPGDYVTAIWAGPSSVVKSNYKSAVQYSHYSLLRTIETNWGFQPFNQTNDGQAKAMTEFLVSPTSNSNGLPLTTLLAVGVVVAAAALIAAVLVIRSRRNRATSRTTPEPPTSPHT